MVIGGIDEDPIISQYVSSTIPYHQDDLTWCVAKAQRSYNLFSFMSTFEPKAWILTFIFILTASLSVRMSQNYLKFYIKSFRNYFTVNMYIMGTMLSQSISLRRLPTSLKLSFGAIFFMSLIFSNVYQSFLVSTLTTPKSSYQISHTQEIFQRRMRVMGSVDNVRHLNKDGEVSRHRYQIFEKVVSFFYIKSFLLQDISLCPRTIPNVLQHRRLSPTHSLGFHIGCGRLSSTFLL